MNVISLCLIYAICLIFTRLVFRQYTFLNYFYQQSISLLISGSIFLWVSYRDPVILAVGITLELILAIIIAALFRVIIGKRKEKGVKDARN